MTTLGHALTESAMAHEDIARLGERSDLRHVHKGKVRQLYLYERDQGGLDASSELLLVASDAISAYDSVLPTPIPGKGRILTALSKFWFDITKEVVPNHYIRDAADDLPPEFAARSMVVRRLDMYPVECVVRGYLSGSGWKEYQQAGAVCGIALPTGLSESEKLPEPIFTPATKAAVGEHDENIDFDRAAEIIGNRSLMEGLRQASIDLYRRASEHALKRGIILADTKFEFGAHPGAEIVLGDEVLTPDSSRFWPAHEYEPGRTQSSFDKQFVRDWLDESGWDHTPPAPELPSEVVAATHAKYLEAYDRITGPSI